jgi:sugar phosphate permease
MDQTRNDVYRWVILGTLFAVHVLTSIGQFSIPPLLPFIKKELGLNYTQVGVFTSAYYLGVALTATFAGWMADLMGVRKMAISGMVLIGVCTLIASRMPTLWWIVFFMVLAGISYSVVTPSTNKATMAWFHERLRATAMGIKQTGINGGGFLAALIVPPIALNFSWRYALAVAAVLVLIGATATWIFYRDPAPAPVHPASPVRCRPPMREVISNRNILLLAVEGFFRVGVQTAFLAYLILYLQNGLKLPIITAGYFFALAHASGAVGRIGWGMVSDRILGGQRKMVYLAVALISGVSFLVFGNLTPATPLWILVVVVLIVGFTAVGHQGVGLSLLVEVAGKECTGTASGFTQSFYFSGVVLMAPLFGWMVDTFGNYCYAWMALGLFSFVASLLVSFVKEGVRKDSVAVSPGEEIPAEGGFVAR